MCVPSNIDLKPIKQKNTPKNYKAEVDRDTEKTDKPKVMVQIFQHTLSELID